MDRDAVTADLRQLEADLSAAVAVLDDMRFQLEDPTELPDTADMANILRSFEDQEVIVKTMQERRAELLEKLG